MTDEQHNRYIAYAFIAHGSFQLLMGLLVGLFFYLAVMFDDPSGPPAPPPAFFAFIFAFMFLFQMLFAVPSFVASYGMLKQKPWARIAGIIAAALSAMNVPVGTAAAVYSLWFFCGEQWKSVYPQSTGGPRTQDTTAALNASAWEDLARDRDAAHTYSTPPPPDWR